MKITPAFFAFLSGLFALSQVSRADGLPHGEWPAFLQRSDMVWNQLPDRWDNAPFLGNGNLGSIFWLTNSNVFRFEVSRSDLYDHRRPGDNYLALHTECRLPNGQFLLELGQSKLSGDLRLDLWNAELRGNVSAGDATWALRCFTHAKKDVIVLELTTISSNAMPPMLTWHPDIAITTRPFKAPLVPLAAYPPQQQSILDGVNVSVRPFNVMALSSRGAKRKVRRSNLFNQLQPVHKPIQIAQLL